MKKIAFIMPHVTGRGGTENVMSIVMRALQKEDSPFRPILYLFGGSEDKRWLEGVNYTETVFSKNRVIRTIQNLSSIFISIFKFIKTEKPDIVIATHSITCFVLYWIRKFTNGNYPIISWVHFSLDIKNVKKDLLKYADFHLALCQGIKNQFRELHIPESKVFVVNNPVFPSDKIIKRPEQKTVFIYVGRVIFEGQKRVKDLLNSLSVVKGNWQLIVIGDGNDRLRCEAYARELGIEGKISWQGWVQSPWDKIEEASALVMTSAFEGLPMVLAEGISKGVYCVSSDCKTGPGDIIKDKVNGELYPPGQTNKLSLILQNIVDKQSLPSYDTVKASIDYMYINRYLEHLEDTITMIDRIWINAINESGSNQ